MANPDKNKPLLPASDEKPKAHVPQKGPRPVYDNKGGASKGSRPSFVK